MYQQLQKIGDVHRIKVFRSNLEKFKQNILCNPKNLPAPTPMLSSRIATMVIRYQLFKQAAIFDCTPLTQYVKAESW